MAAITNTFISSAAKGNREELSDVVSRITPEDTPIYSMLSKEAARSITPEWEIDALAVPGANAVAEGDQYTYAAVAPVVRVKNVMQIMRKDWVISKSQEAIDNAGQAEKRKEVRVKRGVEIKRDTEFAIVSNTASLATGTRLMGSLTSWLTSNVSRGATGANGGYSSGTGLTVAATNGTQRAFTKVIMDSVLQSCRINGGKPKMLVTSPYVRSVFATFMSDANVAPFRYAASEGENALIGTADVYVGPFGKVTIQDSTIMSTNAAVARNAFFLDPSLMSMKVLRKIQDDNDLASNADATTGVIIGEHTLAVKNEAGLGVAADLFGLTAST